jgi:hypothetical protein
MRRIKKGMPWAALFGMLSLVFVFFPRRDTLGVFAEGQKSELGLFYVDFPQSGQYTGQFLPMDAAVNVFIALALTGAIYIMCRFILRGTPKFISILIVLVFSLGFVFYPKTAEGYQIPADCGANELCADNIVDVTEHGFIGDTYTHKYSRANGELVANPPSIAWNVILGILVGGPVAGVASRLRTGRKGKWQGEA